MRCFVLKKSELRQKSTEKSKYFDFYGLIYKKAEQKNACTYDKFLWIKLDKIYDIYETSY